MNLIMILKNQIIKKILYNNLNKNKPDFLKKLKILIINNHFNIKRFINIFTKEKINILVKNIHKIM